VSNPVQRASYAVSSSAEKVANQASSAVSGNPLQKAADAVSNATSGNPLQRAANSVSNAADKATSAVSNATSGNPLQKAANNVSSAANSASSKLASTNAFSGNSLKQVASNVSSSTDSRDTIKESAAKNGIKLPEAPTKGKNADEKTGGGFLSFLKNESPTTDNSGSKDKFTKEVLNSSNIKQIK